MLDIDTAMKSKHWRKFLSCKDTGLIIDKPLKERLEWIANARKILKTSKKESIFWNPLFFTMLSFGCGILLFLILSLIFGFPIGGNL